MRRTQGPLRFDVLMCMIDEARIGYVYYMGNTCNPEECLVTHLVAFADLPNPIQNRWLEMGKARGHDARTDGYVCYSSKRKHDVSSWCRWLPIDVFCHCAHTSVDAMVKSYVEADTVGTAGLLRCTLPGER